MIYEEHQGHKEKEKESLGGPSCPSWMYSPEHGEFCWVIETQTLWGETVCRVWLPGKATDVRLPATRLRPVHEASVGTVDGIAYLAAVARKIPENGLQEDPKLLM